MWTQHAYSLFTQHSILMPVSESVQCTHQLLYHREKATAWASTWTGLKLSKLKINRETDKISSICAHPQLISGYSGSVHKKRSALLWFASDKKILSLCSSAFNLAWACLALDSPSERNTAFIFKNFCSDAQCPSSTFQVMATSDISLFPHHH